MAGMRRPMNNGPNNGIVNPNIRPVNNLNIRPIGGMNNNIQHQPQKIQPTG